LKNRKQVELAIDEADVIIFVVDVEEGITPMDDAVARLLRKVTKPVLLAVNKVDNAMREKDAIEFYNLGLGEYYTLRVFQEVELEIYWMH
jgi:GTP-binding protein